MIQSWLLKSEILKQLIEFDQQLFLQLNKEFTHPFFDNIAPWWRDSNTWLPLYLFLLVFVFVNFGKNAWIWLVFVILTITLSDQVSSGIIKKYFERPRPCSDIDFQWNVRLLLKHCSGAFSFTSSHAANHFALAVFLSKTLNEFIGKWNWVLYAWAASIGYAQIYVGVHYPFDVIGGTIVGLLIGFAVAKFYNTSIKIIAPLQLQPTKINI
ncbi:MAG: phosphatase PAP2 family protein [Chitinophagaceae bacterium]